MYSVNFEILRDMNLPVIMQKPVMQAFVSVLQSVMVEVHADFTSFKAATDIRLTHNGQVYLLRKILNDTFDNNERRITIIDDVIPNDRYIGNAGNINKTMIAANASLPDQFSISNPPQYFGSYDFVIEIPEVLTNAIQQIKQITDTYKLAGKTYEINTTQ